MTKRTESKRRLNVGGYSAVRKITETVCGKVAALLSILLMVTWPVWANDLNKGYTFAVNEHNVTGTKINNLVDLASINTSFFTDKSAETSPQGADLFLIYSASGASFKKCSLSSLLLANLNLITGQTEDFTPATNDYVLTYSTANSAFRKATLQDLVFTNSGLIALQPRSTNAPLPGSLFLVASNGVNTAYALTNILQEWWRWMPFSTNVAPSTNFLLSLHTHPTNNDGLLIWDSQDATNAVTTLIGLTTNLPTVATNAVTNTDVMQIVSTGTNANNAFGTNPTVSQISVPNLLGWRKFVWQFPVPAASGQQNIAHGLPGLPQIVSPVLIETNTAGELGYAAGDELALPLVSTSPLNCVTADTNKLYFTSSGAAINLENKATGVSLTAITKVNWNIKITAYYYPW